MTAQLSFLDAGIGPPPALWRDLGLDVRGDASAWAAFSSCGRFRYVLGREWDEALPTLIVCALNPSTADERASDPTLAKMTGYAKRDSYGSLMLVNAFGLRATDPRELVRALPPPRDRDVAPTLDGIIGPENDAAIGRVLEHVATTTVVVAWGKGPSAKLRARLDAMPAILCAARGSERLHCWGTNADGSPRHPLYLPAEMPLIPWERRP